jgi:CBS domain containing-hemolysin-like protein
LEQLFDFGRRTAREIMVPRVNISALALDLSPEAFSKHLLRDPHTRYPVYEDDVDHVIGAVHIRELMKCVREKRAIDPSDLTPTPFVPETASLNDLLTIMRERRAYLVIVMDEHGGTAGLITLEDLFAELVGVIPESKEDASDSIVEHPSGTLEVEGTVRVDALGQHLGMELVHEEVDTVSGLVLSLLKREPRIGDVVEFDGVQLEVLAVAGHGVTKCRVTIPEPAPLNRSPA